MRTAMDKYQSEAYMDERGPRGDREVLTQDFLKVNDVLGQVCDTIADPSQGLRI